jgi:hypothetical protein
VQEMNHIVRMLHGAQPVLNSRQGRGELCTGSDTQPGKRFGDARRAEFARLAAAHSSDAYTCTGSASCTFDVHATDVRSCRLVQEEEMHDPIR